MTTIKILVKNCGAIIAKNNKKVRDKFTITSISFVGKKKIIKKMECWKFIAGRPTLINLGINSMNPNLTYIDSTKYNELSEEQFENNITALDYQLTIIDVLLQKLNNPINKSGVIVKLDAGKGKSFITAKIIAQLHVKTLIIVPNSGVLDNWKDKIFTKELFPNIDLGYYYTKGKKDGDVVIMVINSALSNVFKIDGHEISWQEYMSTFSMVIYDEVHNYVKTSKKGEIFHRTCMRYRIGLSATPQYAGDFEPALYWYVGDLIDCNQYVINTNIVPFIGTVYKYEYYGPEEYTQIIRNEHNGFISFGKMVKQFAQDMFRHKTIIAMVKKLHSMGRNIIIFTEHIEYCRVIAQELSTEYYVNSPESNVSALLGGASEDDLKNARSSSIIVVTFGYGKEGLSYDQLDTLVFATPRKSGMEQILPRIMRQGGDINIPRIFIDVVDMCSPNFKKQYIERKEIYNKYNFKIIKRQIKWTV